MDKKDLKDYQKSLGERFYALHFTAKGTGIHGVDILYVDCETGIEYLFVGVSGGSLIPLLNPDGSPKINEKWRNGEL
ncbi:DUF6440 family protein [Streptococcus tangpeifui]|uniref:DUF6440 family protein n=1 Tax=Streptococcus tangpeifui TaxID=2709400 RepID=UPI0013EC47FC|nr:MULTISPECIES: DUF6440 family protein [unclassified Streptococcus]